MENKKKYFSSANLQPWDFYRFTEANQNKRWAVDTARRLFNFKRRNIKLIT